MSELESLPLGEAIRLRWVLRDIRARRFIVSPLDRLAFRISPDGLRRNHDMLPVLTAAGMGEI